jgi:hypothetical protein
VQRVARQYVDPSKFVVVVVGDRKSVEPAVRALGLGPITVLETNAVMGGPAPAAPVTPATGAGR